MIGLLDVDWCPGDGIVAMGDVVALLHHLGLPLTQDIPCTNLVGVTPLFRKYGTYLTQHKSSQVIHAFLAGTPSTSGWVGLPFLLCRRFSACLCKLALVRRTSGGLTKFIANGIHSSLFSCIHLRYFLGVGTLLASHLQKAELEQILVIGGDVRWSWPSAHFLQGISCAGCRVISLSSCL